MTAFCIYALVALFSTSQQPCKDTLAHLSSRLPRFAEPELTKLRDSILKTRIDDAEVDLRKRGIGVATIAETVVTTVKELEETMQKAQACAADVFAGNSADLARAMSARRYDDSLRIPVSSTTTTIREIAEEPNSGDVIRSCVLQFISADMTRIATTEVGVQLACRGVRR